MMTMTRRIVTAREQLEMLTPWREAAVNQDLIDRLKGEFHAWRKQQPKGSIFGGGIIGGLNEWTNIERFLKDQYPAAHRGLGMGYEMAGPLLDGRPMQGDHMMPGPLEYSTPQPYETGPEAEAKHGYDPKEVAAGMLLLHNKTDRFRGDLSQEDQARLNDIAQKRYRMQRDYEQRNAARRDPDRLMGININDTHQDYTGQILRGEKTIETRDTRSLNPYVGRRVALYRTHDSDKVPTLVVGHATVGEPVHYPDAASFDADYDRHLVDSDSPHHFRRAKYGEKYGYPMLDPVALDRPQLVLSKGNVARGAEESDFAPYDGPWPLRTAMQIIHPENLKVTWHPGSHGRALADEVRRQNGPRILHDTLRFADDDEYLYVARDHQGTIHGVIAGYDDGVDTDIHDAYTSLKAPHGTGSAMIQTVARDALEGQRKLNVKHVLDHSRNYWQQMGAHIPEGEIDGTWPPEAHRALAYGDNTVPAPFTRIYDDDHNLIDPLDSTRTQIDRAHRLPGSIQ